MKRKITKLIEAEIEVPEYFSNDNNYYMLNERGHIELMPSIGVMGIYNFQPLSYDLTDIKEIGKEDFEKALNEALKESTRRYNKVKSLLESCD